MKRLKQDSNTIDSMDLMTMIRMVEFYKQGNNDLSVMEFRPGRNLIPILVALPFAKEIIAVEHSSVHFEYLQSQMVNISPDPWQTIVETLCIVYPEIYMGFNFDKAIREKLLSVLNLEEINARFDVITTHYTCEPDIDGAKADNRRLHAMYEALKTNGKLMATFSFPPASYGILHTMFNNASTKVINIQSFPPDTHGGTLFLTTTNQ